MKRGRNGQISMNKNWYLWYAWRPVYTNKGFRWFQYVERKDIYYPGDSYSIFRIPKPKRFYTVRFSMGPQINDAN